MAPTAEKRLADDKERILTEERNLEKELLWLGYSAETIQTLKICGCMQLQLDLKNGGQSYD